jgi:hypothetical protein
VTGTSSQDRHHGISILRHFDPALRISPRRRVYGGQPAPARR